MKSDHRHHDVHTNGSFKSGYHGGNNLPRDINALFAEDTVETISLRWLLLTTLRYKWVILLFLVLGTSASWFYADNQTPIYRGEGSMIISEDRGRYSMAGSDLSSLLPPALASARAAGYTTSLRSSARAISSV